MKPLVICILLIVVVTTVSVAVVRFEPAAAAVRQFVSPGPLSPQHAHLGNQCSACHESGVGVTVANCTACHANAERLLGRQPTAFHASVESCSGCHLEHQTANVRPSVMDHLELARLGARTLARASRNLDASQAREVLDCAGCHDRRDPHFKRFGSDCGQCHALESWVVAGYQHPSARSTECVQCHQPPPSHLMKHFSMVSQKFAGKANARVDQCFECHNTTGWNDIVGAGFYKHH